jgi:hypothetical protein
MGLGQRVRNRRRIWQVKATVATTDLLRKQAALQVRLPHMFECCHMTYPQL